MSVEVLDTRQRFCGERECMPRIKGRYRIRYTPGMVTVLVPTRTTDVEKTRRAARAHFDHGADQVIVITGGREEENLNCGAVKANGEWLVRMDDDTRLPQGWNYDLIRKCPGDWGTPYFVGKGIDQAPTMRFRNRVLDTFIKENPVRLGPMTSWIAGGGSAVWVRQPAFWKVGGYDTRWYILSDANLGTKLSEAGFRYSLLPKENPVIVDRYPQGAFAFPTRYTNSKVWQQVRLEGVPRGTLVRLKESGRLAVVA